MLQTPELLSAPVVPSWCSSVSSHLLGTHFSVVCRFPPPSALPLQPVVWVCTHGGWVSQHNAAHPARLRWVWDSMESPRAHVPAIQISAVGPIPTVDCRQR